MGVLLVMFADFAVVPDDSLQEECDLLLVVAVHLLGDETIVLFKQLVLLFFGQPPHLNQLGFYLFIQLLVSFSFLLIAVIPFIFFLIGQVSPRLGQIVQQGLSVVIGASHNDGRLFSALDLLHGSKGLYEVFSPVIGILVEV
jgi:hypothetical protein